MANTDTRISVTVAVSPSPDPTALALLADRFLRRVGEAVFDRALRDAYSTGMTDSIRSARYLARQWLRTEGGDWCECYEIPVTQEQLDEWAAAGYPRRSKEIGG